MKSSSNTSPALRNARSLSRVPSASRKDPQPVGIFLSSFGGRSYRSLSTAEPGSTLFLIPSRPAMSIAENARYGLAHGSGKRTSTRLAFGLAVHGIRQAADRLRTE